MIELSCHASWMIGMPLIIVLTFVTTVVASYGIGAASDSESIRWSGLPIAFIVSVFTFFFYSAALLDFIKHCV